jgi:DNA-binding NtrC family response regulator
MSTVLCIDDEPAVGVVVEHALSELGHEPVLATSVEDGLKIVNRQPVDLIISDFRMPSASGLDLLDHLKEMGFEIPVIIMTGYSSIENAVLSMRHGAVDYLTKPLRQEALRIAVANAIEVARLRRENEQFRRELESLQGPSAIVGKSPALQQVLDTIASVAPTRATVLLEGESGTGKELFARLIHTRSGRPGQLVTINCAALPEGLVESALFGHERGAFTGATQRTQGAFERAHQGTLLLDEISEMRLDLQAKLLRAIQEQEFERVGGHQPIKVNVRIVATTNRDLAAEAEAGRFRRDLYFRLSVVPIRTPALRERLEDIPLLVEHFVRHAAQQMGTRPPVVPPETIAYLQRLPWPGNVRELANAVERAVILNRDKSGRLLPEAFGAVRPAPAVALPNPAAAPGTLPATFNLRELEEFTIRRALEATGGHRARAAELLGISERTLRNKLNVRPGETGMRDP